MKLPMIRLMVIGFSSLIIIVFYSLWQNYQTQIIIDQFRKNEEIQIIRSQIQQQLQSLQLAAQMGAITGYQSWENKFQEDVNNIDKLRRHAKSIIGDSEQDAALEVAIEKFKRMSGISFRFVREGKPAQARAIAESFDFEMALDDLNESLMETNSFYLEKYNMGLQDLERARTPIKWFTLVMLLLVLSMLYLGYISIRGWQRSVNQLNFELEALVSQKTNEIQEQSEQLIMSNKLSSMGEVAAGIGHEINNPLSIIVGKLSLLQLKISKNPIVADTFGINDDIDKMMKMSERISKIVRGLKVLSRSGWDDGMAPAALGDLVDNAVVFQEHNIKMSSIGFQVQNFNRELKVECNDTQIIQVLVNLIGNSVDAVRGLEGAWIFLETDLTADYLDLRITDSGSGIPTELVAKIFDPFFTTKPKGKGTGLGIPLSKKIMTKHGGDIFIDMSAKNTCFVIRFPISRVSNRS